MALGRGESWKASQAASLADAANAFVAAQVKRHGTASAEGRRAILFETLHAFTEPGELGTLCQELSRSSRYLDYCFRHNNGFFVLYLADPDIGFQVRLHVWSPTLPPSRENPHRHRMNFASKIMAGVLHSTTYSRADAPPDASGADIFQEICIHGPALTDFDAGQVRFETVGLVALTPEVQQVYERGMSYYFDARQIHKVDTPETFADPVVTLTVWEPAFQESIAYETVGKRFDNAEVPVTRLSTAMHKDMLACVMVGL